MERFRFSQHERISTNSVTLKLITGQISNLLEMSIQYGETKSLIVIKIKLEVA